MSWTQGIAIREELPAKFVAWADAKKGARLEYITWFEPDQNVFWLDYGEAGSLKATMRKEEQ